jgi:hypothetical protein
VTVTIVPRVAAFFCFWVGSKWAKHALGLCIVLVVHYTNGLLLSAVRGARLDQKTPPFLCSLV